MSALTELIEWIEKHPTVSGWAAGAVVVVGGWIFASFRLWRRAVLAEARVGTLETAALEWDSKKDEAVRAREIQMREQFAKESEHEIIEGEKRLKERERALVAAREDRDYEIKKWDAESEMKWEQIQDDINDQIHPSDATHGARLDLAKMEFERERVELKRQHDKQVADLEGARDADLRHIAVHREKLEAAKKNPPPPAPAQRPTA